MAPSQTVPIISGWIENCRVGFSHTGKTPSLYGAHNKQSFAFLGILLRTTLNLPYGRSGRMNKGVRYCMR